MDISHLPQIFTHVIIVWFRAQNSNVLLLVESLRLGIHTPASQDLSFTWHTVLIVLNRVLALLLTGNHVLVITSPI